MIDQQTKRYRPSDSIGLNEPATAFKVDGRGCLNKRPPPHTGQLPVVGTSASVECIRVPWNVSVTLITRRLSRRSLFVRDANSAASAGDEQHALVE